MMTKHTHINNIIKNSITEVKPKINSNIKSKSENLIQPRVLHKCPKCPLEFLAKSEMKVNNK